MKSIAIALCLLVLCTGAQAWAEGAISLVEYSTAHDYNCYHVYENTTITLELGIFFPVNPDFGSIGERTVTNISGFECKLIPNEGVIIVGINFPVPVINVGQGYELIVGFGEPVPVDPTGKTVVATVDIMFGGETSFPLLDEAAGPCYLTNNTWISVAEVFPASIPGSVAFLDADDPFDPLVAATYNAGPDFRFNLLADPTVATEARSWESLKALYR